MTRSLAKKAAPLRTRQRLSAGERTREILDATIELLAEKGLSATLENIAERVQVTQPLIHQYFPTREKLIESVKLDLLNGHWDPTLAQKLRQKGLSLGARIAEFYKAYLPVIEDRRWSRAFVHLALADAGFAQRYTKNVTTQFLHVIIDETRSRFGFPALSAVPPHAREVELAWEMHSVFAFRCVRQHIYEIPVPDVGQTIKDQVTAYLAAAPKLMAELMDKEPGSVRAPGKSKHVS